MLPLRGATLLGDEPLPMVSNKIFVTFLATLVFPLIGQQAFAQESATSAFIDQRGAALHFIQPVFDMLDCEGVGVIEAGEVDEHFHQLFFGHDIDQSRDITLAEFKRFSKADKHSQDKSLFALIDRDNNQKVTAVEYRDYLIKSIDIADTNRNGELTRREAGLPPVKRIQSRVTKPQNKSTDKNAEL